MVGHGGIWAGILDTCSSISVVGTVRRSSLVADGRRVIVSRCRWINGARMRRVGLPKLRPPLSVACFQEGDTGRARSVAPAMREPSLIAGRIFQGLFAAPT